MAKEKPSSNSYRHILKYTGVFGGVQVFNILIGLVRNKFVAILLGPGGMGLVSLLNTSMNFISQATGLGVSFSAVRQISEFHDKGDMPRLSHYISVVRQWSAIAALLGILVCIAAGPLLNALSFSWGNHTIHFILLAPAVAMTAICGGELAILKGTKRLKQLASIQVITALLSLVISIPLFYFFNYKAILPAIILTAMANMLPAVMASHSYHPYRLALRKGLVEDGKPMLRLGIAFTVAAAFTSGSDMMARALLNQVADLETVGLFNAAYMITITYSSMVFSSLESDFFPRLSAANHDNRQVCDIVNRQIEVSLIVIAPLLAGLITALPIALPLLFSKEFLPAASMAQTTALAMFIKAMSLPIAYINLAKGNSRIYLTFESLYAIVFTASVIWSFKLFGLYGVGWAIVAVHALELMALYVYANKSFSLKLSSMTLNILAVNTPLLAIAYLSATSLSGVAYWAIGIAATATAAAYTFKRLRDTRKA